MGAQILMWDRMRNLSAVRRSDNLALLRGDLHIDLGEGLQESIDASG
jgi:hypothetical protein